MKTKIHCPDCKTIELTHHVDVEPVLYKGKTLQVCGYEWFDCANCGEEFIPPAQARSNHLKISDAKRQNDNLLTSSEIKDLRLALDLTQQQLSELLSDSENCVQKYESGEVTQSRPTNTLMNLLVAGYIAAVRDAKHGGKVKTKTTAKYYAQGHTSSLDNVEWQDPTAANEIEFENATKPAAA